jgi:hypothetical protein
MRLPGEVPEIVVFNAALPSSASASVAPTFSSPSVPWNCESASPPAARPIFGSLDVVCFLLGLEVLR